MLFKKMECLFLSDGENEELRLTKSQMLALLLCDAMQNATSLLHELYVQFKLLPLLSAAGVLGGFPQRDDYEHE